MTLPWVVRFVKALQEQLELCSGQLVQARTREQTAVQQRAKDLHTIRKLRDKAAATKRRHSALKGHGTRRETAAAEAAAAAAKKAGKPPPAPPAPPEDSDSHASSSEASPTAPATFIETEATLRIPSLVAFSG